MDHSLIESCLDRMACNRLTMNSSTNVESLSPRSEKFAAMATRTRHEYLKDLATNQASATTLDNGNKFCE